MVVEKKNLIKVNSPDVTYTDNEIITKYRYETTSVDIDHNGNMIATPKQTEYTFRTKTTIPKFGLMIIGIGGNNGSTVTASILANKYGLEWKTRDGVKSSNYFGSLMMSSTTKLGTTLSGQDINVAFNSLLPTVHPNDFIIGGWDINSANLAVAMERACVLEPDLQQQLYPYLVNIKPMPSIYYPDYIAANQSDRADNLINGNLKYEHVEKIRSDIRQFKEANNLDSIVIIWSANTERFSSIIEGVNDTAENLMNSIRNNHEEIAPSTIFAVAAILENVPFINGSPQNTFVPGCVDLAEKHESFIGGDDFKSGQTKVKSVLADFLVNAGLKPIAITSYNHLGNNDGKNLSAPEQFKSKEISKSNVVDDIVESNRILYESGEKPDHVVVIKYVPSVGDSKRALDEYVSRIFMNGLNTMSIYNTCEDSLLASPLIIDLAIITELMTRVEYKTSTSNKYKKFNSILSILSYMLKAPLVPENTPIVNSLTKQRNALENIFRAFIGLRPQNDMLLEHKAFSKLDNKNNFKI